MPLINKYKLQLFTIFIFSTLLFCSCTKSKEAKKSEYVDIMRSDELTDEALVKSWNLLTQGQQLADAGKSIDAIVKTFPEGTLVSTNATSVLFFIDGSIPMVIELDKNSKQKRQYKGAGGNSVSTSHFNAPQSLSTLPLASSFYYDDKLVDVIASDKSDDERQQKKALILAPYYNTDFKGFDDATIANRLLKANRNYKANIVFRKENLTLEDFTSFAEYDLVHLSTHGENYCEVEELDYNENGELEWKILKIQGCISRISTGIKHGIKDLTEENKLEYIKKNYKNHARAIYLSEDEVYLKPVFFNYFHKNRITNRTEIEGGLKDKIWVFSACGLGPNGMTEYVMEGILEDSHFFYWSNSVTFESSIFALDGFYDNLITKGLDAEKAFNKIPNALKENLPASLKDTTAKTSLLHLQTGDPRHAIEVIDMLNPDSEKLIAFGDNYPIKGNFNDGEDELITLKVKLKGYTLDEFIEKSMTISLKVDNKTVLDKIEFPGDGVTVETINEYSTIVTIKDIKIPDVGSKKKLTLKASLHLNDEHVSIHKEQVSISDYYITAIVDGVRKSINENVMAVYRKDPGLNVEEVERYNILLSNKPIPEAEFGFGLTFPITTGTFAAKGEVTSLGYSEVYGGGTSVKAWGAGELNEKSSGTITISEINDTYIKGTFSFIGVGFDRDRTTKVVTDGEFKALNATGFLKKTKKKTKTKK